MKIELNEQEADELRTLLDATLGDLSAEIADTDDKSYREGLKERRERLRSLRSKLGA